MSSELWKDICGFEGFYQISNKGRVKSLNRMVAHCKGGLRLIKDRVLKSVLRKDGYLELGLCKNGSRMTKKVHRLMAETFIKNPNNYPQINHKNGIKTDNRVENLEWCDQSHNMRHAYKIGLMPPKGHKGEKNPGVKLTKKQVKEIKAQLLHGYKCVDIAKQHGVNKNTISAINTGQNWGHVVV